MHNIYCPLTIELSDKQTKNPTEHKDKQKKVSRQKSSSRWQIY